MSVSKIKTHFLIPTLLLSALIGASCQRPAHKAPKSSDCLPLPNETNEDFRLCPTMGRFGSMNFIKDKNPSSPLGNVFITQNRQTRAVVVQTGAHKTDDQLETLDVCFSYSRNGGAEKAFASGLVRHQIGIKLRAQDSCNVVYVMWRIFPENRVVISQKLNGGQNTHSQCQNRGYKTIASLPSPSRVEEGELHLLKAQIKGSHLFVFADEKLIWKGILDEEVSGLRGPMGLRTDNGQFMFRLGQGQQSLHGCSLHFPIRPVPAVPD